MLFSVFVPVYVFYILNLITTIMLLHLLWEDYSFNKKEYRILKDFMPNTDETTLKKSEKPSKKKKEKFESFRTISFRPAEDQVPKTNKFSAKTTSLASSFLKSKLNQCKISLLRLPKFEFQVRRA